MSSNSQEFERETGPIVWDYLNYRVLTQLEKEQEDWRHVTSGQFSKLPCIADRYLKEEYDTNIRFPRYWYQFGEVGNRYPIDSRLYIVEEKDWGKAIRPIRNAIDFDIPESLRGAIDKVVDWVVEEFANCEIEEVKSYQYDQFAPNEFIRRFEDLRQDIYDVAETIEIDSDSLDDEDELRVDLHSQLEGIVVEYEDDLYEEMRHDFLKWEDTMHILISEGDFWRLEANFEEFWSVFSKVHLRMEHNNNPIQDQLDSWKAENEQILDKYRQGLCELRGDVLDDREPTGSIEPIKSSYSQAVRDIADR